MVCAGEVDGRGVDSPGRVHTRQRRLVLGRHCLGGDYQPADSVLWSAHPDPRSWIPDPPTHISKGLVTVFGVKNSLKVLSSEMDPAEISLIR